MVICDSTKKAKTISQQPNFAGVLPPPWECLIVHGKGMDLKELFFFFSFGVGLSI